MPAGTYTMTNLKGAVPDVSSDKLSAFHPNGTGNETAFGDFAMEGIGWDSDNDTIVDDTKLPCSEVNGNDGDAAGSYSGDFWVFNDGSIELDPQFTDSFKVRVDLELAGDYVAEQIVTRMANWTFVENNCSVDTITRIDTSTVEIECSVTAFGDEGGIQATFADGMNDGIANYNTTLTWKTDAWETAAPRIAYSGKQIWFDDSGSSGSGHEWAINIQDDNTAFPASDVLFDPNGQIDTANSTWEIFKNGTSRGTTSGAPGFTFFVTETESAGGDDWKLTLHDSNGNFVDAVTWTWGDSSAPYDDGGDPAAGTFTRDGNTQASGVNSPENCSVATHTLDDPNSPLA